MSPRGGPRKGSGRPRLQDARVPVTIRLHPATAAAIRATPQARADARQLLEAAFATPSPSATQKEPEPDP